MKFQQCPDILDGMSILNGQYMVGVVIFCLLNSQIIHAGVFFLPRAVDRMFVFSPKSYVEGFIPNAMLFGGGAFEK